MTNLERITAKIFGETATATGDDPQIGQFGSALAGTYIGTTNVDTIQSLPAWSNGFIDSVTPNEQFPPLPEMTGFGKVLSHQIAYTLQKGVPEWDSGTTYYEGDFAKGVGEGKLYVSKVDSNLNNDLSDTDYWEEFSSNNFRNIGEIVTSTIPLTDAGLHLLDGSLLQYGSYQAFIDYIADLYDSGNYDDIFETEANWQSTITTYGVCGKFVYDSVNNTVRLPKITGFTEGTITPTTVGDLTEAGLPNVTGTISKIMTGQGASVGNGAFSLSLLGNETATGGSVIHGVYGVSFDASSFNQIYGNSSTVQPQSIKILYYIVISTSAKTNIQVDIDEIATDLNGKCDVDGTNATFPHIVESYVNGASWYNVYSNGFCEQGGELTSQPYTTGAFDVPVVLLQSYKDTNYNVTTSGILATTHQAAGGESAISDKSTTGFSVHGNNGFVTSTNPFMWTARGYIR